MGQPPPDPPAALRLDIDTDALAANWRALDRLSGAAAAGAAIKADGYGLGAARVVRVLAAAGCRDFFVAHWSEAAALRGVLDPSRLAVLHGPVTAADAAFSRASGVRPVINSLAQARRWRDAGGGPCDLMIDTGMNRLGVGLDELGDEAIGALDIDVLHSHLVSAEVPGERNVRQRERWDAARGMLRHRRASLANSAGIALGPAFHGDLTRPGIALYGGIPCDALAPLIRPVARPCAAIIQVRDIGAGDCVGYDATFTATAPMRIGTIALGYADGYLRRWSEVGAMSVDGARLPVLGRVSMDLTAIDLSNARQLTEGDWVQADYDLRDAAQKTSLSQYELLTLLGRRFARRNCEK